MEHQEHTDNFLDFFVGGTKQIGFSIKDDLLEKFHLYYQELRLWNKSVNMTGLQTDKEQAVLLFADSLAGSLVFPKNTSLSIIDIGTGGGFPGIPLKLVFPSLRVTLMEPRGNKTAFLHNVIGKLALTGITVLQKRLDFCQTLNNEEGKWDIAISKAVSLETILPNVENILKKNGKLIVFRSKHISKQENINGMTIDQEISYELPYGYGTRVISMLKLVP